MDRRCSSFPSSRASHFGVTQSGPPRPSTSRTSPVREDGARVSMEAMWVCPFEGTRFGCFFVFFAQFNQETRRNTTILGFCPRKETPIIRHRYHFAHAAWVQLAKCAGVVYVQPHSFWGNVAHERGEAGVPGRQNNDVPRPGFTAVPPCTFI